MKKEEKKVSKVNETKQVNEKKDSKKVKKYTVQKKTIKKEKKKKDNIFKRIGKYFKGVGKEIKRIRWTTGKELVKYSIATMVFVLFFGLYFYGIDWIVLLVRSLAK